jgi:hypothetical protein
MTFSMIQKDKSPEPFRCLIHGTEGVGKSTFAACAPKPIFVPPEDGLGQIAVDHFPLAENFDQVILNLNSLLAGKHDYMTVVIDSIDWLERLATRKIIESQTKTHFKTLADFGYGSGYAQLIPLFEAVLGVLIALRAKKNMNIVLVAHSKLEKVEDPGGSSYDQYAPRLDKRINGMMKEWVDVIGFAAQNIRREETDEGFGRTRTTAKAVRNAGGSDRILVLNPTPAIVAKTRYKLPGEMPLDGKRFFYTLYNIIYKKT